MPVNREKTLLPVEPLAEEDVDDDDELERDRFPLCEAGAESILMVAISVI